MSVNVLGVSGLYHDSAAALAVNGQLVAACAEDRFSRVKHDSSLPFRAAEFCLSSAGLAAADLDAVVFYERPEYKFIRVLTMLLARYPFGSGRFARGIVSWVSEKLWVGATLCERLQVDAGKIRFVEHHDSHAAYAFYASPYSSAATLTLDGVGEDTCGALGKADRANGVAALQRTPFPHSLGLVYGAVTGFLGFKPNDEECSTMALSAFGRPSRLDAFEKIVSLDGQARPEVRDGYFDFSADESQTYLETFREAFGPPRRNAGAGYSAFEDCAPPRAASAGDGADIAASVQRRTEDVILAQATRLRDLTGETSVCIGGGVAYNAVAIGRICREGPFESVFIPPDPGDGGGAAGAALIASAELGAAPAPHGAAQVYAGPAIEPRRLLAMSRHLDPSAWAGFTLTPQRALPEDGLRVEEFASAEAMVASVAQRLLDGEIVGWARGRAEFGPRALGARSILCDPGNIETAKRLSAAVKRRAAFRPYALSIAERDAPAVFAEDMGQPVYKWMQATAPVRPDAAPSLRAAMHADGTTRPHVCAREDNPVYYDLLTAFGARRGVAALLNTSLNDSGEPLAATAEDALLIFARTDMDALVVDDIVFSKKRETRQ